jgi:hypothetical protein
MIPLATQAPGNKARSTSFEDCHSFVYHIVRYLVCFEYQTSDHHNNRSCHYPLSLQQLHKQFRMIPLATQAPGNKARSTSFEAPQLIRVSERLSFNCHSFVYHIVRYLVCFEYQTSDHHNNLATQAPGNKARSTSFEAPQLIDLSISLIFLCSTDLHWVRSRL